MHKSSPALTTRRAALIMTGAAGLLAAAPLSRALAAVVATPTQTSGPFYPRSKPDDSDKDLTHVVGRSQRAAGEVIEVEGRLLDVRGHVLAGAWIELWQADAFGIYKHPGDPAFSKADPNFQGYAAVRTDKQGAYRFRTIKPKYYGAGSFQRTPHIHFRIIEGSTSRLVTQMYFPNEPLNQKDVLFSRLGGRDEKGAATAQLVMAGSPEKYHFDFVV